MRILITIKASENGWNVFRIPSQEEYARWRVVRTCIRLIFVTRLAEAQARSKYSVIVSCQPVLRQNYRCFCLLFSWNDTRPTIAGISIGGASVPSYVLGWALINLQNLHNIVVASYFRKIELSWNNVNVINIFVKYIESIS